METSGVWSVTKLHREIEQCSNKGQALDAMAKCLSSLGYWSNCPEQTRQKIENWRNPIDE